MVSILVFGIFTLFFFRARRLVSTGAVPLRVTQTRAGRSLFREVEEGEAEADVRGALLEDMDGYDRSAYIDRDGEEAGEGMMGTGAPVPFPLDEGAADAVYLGHDAVRQDVDQVYGHMEDAFDSPPSSPMMDAEVYGPFTSSDSHAKGIEGGEEGEGDEEAGDLRPRAQDRHHSPW